MWAQTGRMPAELDVAELPWCMEYVWTWFLSLNSERQRTDMGSPKPLSSEQITAWQGLNDVRLTAVELLAIRVLDVEYLTAESRRAQAGKGRGP